MLAASTRGDISAARVSSTHPEYCPSVIEGHLVGVGPYGLAFEGSLLQGTSVSLILRSGYLSVSLTLTSWVRNVRLPLININNINKTGFGFSC